MQVGVMLPYLDPNLSRDELVQWCVGIEAGPFSTIACGERIAFDNFDQMSLLAAAAALTRRVGLLSAVAVLPMHATGLFAKQTATIDRLSEGRLTLGVGIGGRPEDYAAAEKEMRTRYARLDEQVGELRRIWSGVPSSDGGWSIGPAPAQTMGPPLLAGAYGPKALARAAQWADGFIGGSAWENGRMAMMGKGRHHLTVRNWLDAWNTAGREGRPRLVGLAWFTLADDGPATMHAFGSRYFSSADGAGVVFAPEMAPLVNADRLGEALHDFAQAGFDELILLPVSARLLELERLERLVGQRT
jgi:alkanesulfonate monooxygenase SsuD/methylene tetrahydromethanopterin reductase-like flavin-dependent oxidoreductase (luciferase family)